VQIINPISISGDQLVINSGQDKLQKNTPLFLDSLSASHLHPISSLLVQSTLTHGSALGSGRNAVLRELHPDSMPSTHNRYNYM